MQFPEWQKRFALQKPLFFSNETENLLSQKSTNPYEPNPLHAKITPTRTRDFLYFQDGPFLAFRLILITHYKIVSYMNIFFTCKNTLVILLQLYRLYVVQSEGLARRRRQRLKCQERRHRGGYHQEIGGISIVGRERRRDKRKIVSDGDEEELEERREEKRRRRRCAGRDAEAAWATDSEELGSEGLERYEEAPRKKAKSDR